MTPVDLPKLKQWLQSKGPGGATIKCPVCTTSNWEVQENVIRRLATPVGGQWSVELACKNCGFIMELDAKIIGQATPD